MGTATRMEYASTDKIFAPLAQTQNKSHSVSLPQNFITNEFSVTWFNFHEVWTDM